MVALLAVAPGGGARAEERGESAHQSAAGAEPPPSETIAVTRLAFSGFSTEIETELQRITRNRLRSAGFTLLDAQAVDNKLNAEQRLLSCTTPTCYGRLAQVLGVRRVVEGEVQRLALSTFAMKIQIRDLMTGRLTAPTVSERCDVCSNDDVKQMVARATDTLVQMAPPLGPQSTDRPSASGMLVLETDPPGAEVVIDGHVQIERTPASYLLAAGVHSLEVRGSGYKSLRQSAEILPDGQQSLSLVMTPLPARRPWLTALTAIGAMTTIGLVAGSATLFVYNGRPVNTPTCPDQPGVEYRCPQKYDNTAIASTMAVGAGLTLAATIAGIYFDYTPPRRRNLNGPRPAPPPSPEPAQTSTQAPTPSPTSETAPAAK